MAVRISPGLREGHDKARLARISGQNPHLCMQCGMCSGACPLMEEMESNPRIILHFLQLGLTRRALAANTAWICASCLQCQVVCPRGLDLPRLMEALRLMELRRNRLRLDPAALPGQVLRTAPPIALVAALRKMS